MAAPPKAADKKPAKKSGKLRFVTVLIMLGCMLPFFVPLTVLVLAALIPTYIAFMFDDDAQKSGAVSVGVMNFAGTVPFIIDLFSKGQTMENAIRILTDSHAWLVILGAAGIGELIVYAIPQAIATMTLTHAESRVKLLRGNMEMLKDSWGPDVATSKPLEKISQS